MRCKHNTKDILLMLLVVVSSLLVVGCSGDTSDDSEDEGFKLYYINQEGTRLETVSYELESSETDDRIQEIYKAMCEDREDMVSVIPTGVKVISYSLSEEILTLNFGTYYSSMDSVTEIFLRSAVVLTLTQLEDISYVTFNINGQPLKDANGNTIGTMKASNFIDKVGNTLNNYESTTVTLYFANLKGNALRTEIRTGVYDSSKSLERYIVEQIIKGSASDGSYRTVSKQLEIRSINTNNGICYIDFSDEFLRGTSSVKDEIMIYSIVNSLTELSYISKVQISVEGEVDVTLHNKISLNTLFLRDLSYMEK